MNERLIGILDNYDVELQSFHKGRGSLVCETGQGLKILKEFTGREERILEINPYLNELKRRGFPVETYLKNKEGRYLCRDREQNTYVLKDYFEGRECRTLDTEDLRRAFAFLGRLQGCLREIGYLPAEELPEEEPEDPGNDAEGLEREPEDPGNNAEKSEREPEGAGNDAERRRGESAESGNNAEKPEREPEGAGNNAEKLEREPAESESRSGETMQGQQAPVRTSRLKEDVIKKNRELRRIRKFLRAKSPKSEFEELLMQHYDFFFGQADAVEKKLEQETFCNKAVLCHGDFQYHNLLFLPEDIAVINFEKMQYDDASRDLAHFFRKVMEKCGWDKALARQLLESYERHIQMDDEAYRQFLYRISYPEKFRKIANHYMNSKKTGLSDKNREKLGKIIAQEDGRRECVLFLQSR